VSRFLEEPSDRRREEFLDAVGRSHRLHGEWTSAPDSRAGFASYLQNLRSPSRIGYWVLTDHSELAGVVTISEIVRGAFCSGYLGYYALDPHQEKGFMKRGLSAVIAKAFREHRLHRLEANIQPGNDRSLGLVQRLGFRNEGFSPRYLKIRGRWRDHERWALTAEDWREKKVRS
jgi:ribosomal-protein-alanine N-acetyltransferase